MNDDHLNALADQFGGEEQEPQLPDGHHGIKLDLNWRPNLNPVQTRVYDSQAYYILAYGERGTGKSIGALHKAVRHCVNNKNARYLIVVREIGQAADGGAYSKLQTEVLPTWKNGNWDRKKKKYLDKGCGIEYTASKLDPSDKKPYIWISNKFGGWSIIKLISLFVGEHVEDKVKGKEPSGIFVDEAQTMESAEYFTKLIQQVGRVQDITDPQQVVYGCNPKGPMHWLYQTFFCHSKDDDGTLVEWPIDEVTGHPIDPSNDKPKTEYAIFHVPISENAHNLPKGYWENILNACKNDPVEYARMVEGKWVDKPEGAAIFADVWNEDLIRGNAIRDVGILPMPNHPVLLGWDPGQANTSVHMMQVLPVNGKNGYESVWSIFDEMNYVGRRMTYRELVPKLIDRLIYWEHAASEWFEKKVEFKFWHITDDSAFNQFRAKDGSFDAQDIEDISKAYVERKQLNERFIIRMRACPKGPNSVDARVRLTTDALGEKRAFISATCIQTREMFMRLEAEKDNRFKPRRSIYIHPFDSLSYPILYVNSGAGRSVSKVRKEEVPAECYRI